MMKNLAIVPARGGSKRLPGKNKAILGGKPLVQHTLDAVLNSGVFDTVILSSDDQDILDIGASIEGVTPEKRDASLAGDKVKVIDLIKQIADRPGYAEQYAKIGLFLPTCPFRTAKHISEGYKLLSEDDFSVVSVCEMGDPVQLTLTIDEEQVMNPEALLSPSPLVTGHTRSQDFQTYYRVNGGFYIAWLEKFRQVDNFFQGRVKAYVMERINSADIDNQIDMDWASHLLEHNHISL